MNHPDWLTEFHRRWHTARSRTTQLSSRAYGIHWTELLDAAGITRVEDIRTATREAETLEREGKLHLKRHKYRREIIERLVLPLESESWLHELFGTEDGAAILTRSLRVIDRQPDHPLLPDEWSTLLAKLHGLFREGMSLRPFSWKRPEHLSSLLDLLFNLTSRTWPEGTLIRSASIDLGYDSKFLERRERSINAGLSLMFARSSSLAELGFIMSEAMLLTQGPLVLHFPDGRSIDYSHRAPHKISLADLELASRIETPARRLLSIENSKTTFRQFAAANRDTTTLLVASSFPTAALITLLRKLPSRVELHHFGDSDATGFLILLKIREVAPRPVHAFHMKWRGPDPDVPLSDRDIAILGNLSENPLLADCQGEINALTFTQSMGRFEQESLGPPTIQGWPFFEADHPMG
ncbi:Wadjet anti-phage system protein JetD domain-containing protein [Haloferula chungangensis]|uniref:Wadjet anti-phage system protein JetD domain-containing protein n=1 Tax=Haloferula chungangensis TaxID=1048331 RepID=A0ABW2L9N6_9BACT